MKTIVETPKANKPKTKKQIIAEVLAITSETDVKKAYQDYVMGLKSGGCPPEGIASESLFKFVWVRVKGAPSKTEKTKVDDESVRTTIREMFVKQEELFKPVQVNRTKALLTDDADEKKKFLKLAESGMDAVTAQNRAIRDFMEKNAI